MRVVVTGASGNVGTALLTSSCTLCTLCTPGRS